MKRQELKEIIRNIIMEIKYIDEDGGAMPANVTPNIGGYDGPFGPVMKRKIPKRTKKGVKNK